MKKTLFGVAALGLLGLAGAGVGLKAQDVVEAKADATDYIYLNNVNWTDARYAAYFFTDSDHNGTAEASEWVNFEWDPSIYYNKVAIPSTPYEQVVLCRMNNQAGHEANNWDNRWDSTEDLPNHTGIYKPYSKSGKGSDGSWEYPLTVGDTTTYMIPYGSDKVTAALTVEAGDSVTLKNDEDSTSYPVNAENKPSNNLAESTIKVDGSVELFVSKEGWNAWASGYAPANTTIQDFCDALLSLGCEATNEQLAALNWSGEGVKAAINGATIALGDDKSYTDWGNVVNEAATRYVNLISNGLSPIDGVTLASRTVPGAFEATVSSNSPVLAISITSIAALVAISTFFIVRKRKEDR